MSRPNTSSSNLAVAWGCILASFAMFIPGGAAAEADPDWTTARVRTVVDGLNGPANFDIAPDGSIWFAEVYTGNVSRFDPVSRSITTQHHVRSVASNDERGLVGFALDVNFSTNGAFYAYYTFAGDDPGADTNRVVRVQAGKEMVLTTIPAAEEHNGGRIVVAPDGTLFVSTGENQLRDPAQDPGSPLGKILHMTSAGGPVAGNLEGLVYSRGHRNVYGLAYEPASGRLWATENSGWRRDEINIITARGNYGYPECEGLGLNGVSAPCPRDKGYVEPILTFYEDRTAAPVGATFWRGEFYWLSLKEGSIHRVVATPSGWSDAVVYDGEEALLDLRVGPDGRSLYFSSWTAIHELEFPNLGDNPPQRVPAGVASGPAMMSFIAAGIVVALAGRQRPAR